MESTDKIAILDAVRAHYTKAAGKQKSVECCSAVSACYSPHPSSVSDQDLSKVFSYSQKDLEDLPEDAFMGLGCGNPGAVASVRPGETVLDLGSGGGIDCFMAAKKVGKAGIVIGVDMTPEMVRRARDNVLKYGYHNVDFRLGEIENLPVADQSVDVMISNCVINLSPDKPKVFSEAFRVLKPGGRLAIADMVAAAPLTEEIRKDPSLYVGCIAGALFVEDLKAILAQTGFENVVIRFRETELKEMDDFAPGTQLGSVVKPAMVEAVKPGVRGES
jgi:arsenite methyltransferase